MVNYTQHSRANGHSSGYSCCIYPRNAMLGIMANGNFTTGRVNAGSMSASDVSGNYNYSDIDNGYCQAFNGYPDGIRFWASFYATGNGTYLGANAQAQLTAIIHDNFNMHDPSNDDNHVVCSLKKQFGRTTTASNTTLAWQCYTADFEYKSNSITPQYIIVTFTTNKQPGKGNENDRLYMDDIEMIYIGKMSDIKVNGQTVSGFNQNTYDYTVCYSGNIPNVTATAVSSIANTKNQVSITQASASNNYTATINRLGSDTTYTIHFVSGPTINLSDNGYYSVCAGDEITVTASGNATSYSWSNGLGNGATVHPTAAGDYTVTGTDANGCTSTATAHVTINALPTITISGNTSICSGASTTLTAGGASTYLWSNNSTATSINVSTGGTYTVTGTTNGCSNSASVVVTAYEAPVVTINGPTPNSVCAGTPVTLTANGASDYFWSDNLGSTASVNPPTTTAGNKTYTVTGTDIHNCTGTASYQLTVKQMPWVEISGSSTICNNSTGSLSVNVNPSTTPISWAHGGNDNPLTISSAGSYIVTADLNGCSASDTFDVATAPAPAAPTVTPGSRCGSGSVTLSAQGEAGTTLMWYANNSATASSIGTGNTYSTPNLTAPTTTYYVSAQYNGGCSSARVPVTATILENPGAPTVTDISNCGETDITLTASNVGSNTLKWYSDAEGNNEITALNQHVTNITTFYAATIASNGCRSELQPMTVNIKPVPAAPTVVSPEPYCSNGSVSVTFSATVPSGHIAKWYDEGHTFIFQGTQTQSVNQSKTYYVTSYSNNTQCESNPVAFNVVINSLPAAPEVSNDSICGEGNITLSATSTHTVTWYSTPTGGTSISTYQHISGNTTFYAEATDANNCHSTRVPMTVTMNPVYDNLNDYKSACGSYTWEGTTYQTSGSYEKQLTSSLGCDSIVTLHLTIHNGYNQTFDTTVCDQFVWQGHTVTSSQSVTEHLQSLEGCDSTVTYNVTVKHNSYSTKSLTLCSSQLPYSYAGTQITSAGLQTITIPNAEDCDSIITLNVTVNTTPDEPTITSLNLSRCGAGTINLSVGQGNNSNGCRWYASESDETPLTTGNSYQANLTETTTFYVSSYTNAGCESERIAVTATVNPVPANPQITTAEDTRCGAGEVILSASIGDDATQCRWYSNENPNNTNVLSYENSYTVNFANNQSTTRTYYVESYNENTQCKSATRVAATAIENAVPAAPQVTAATHCGTLTTDLTDYVTSTTDMLRWYDSNEVLLSENAHYTTTVNATTVYLVSNYNAETSCESPKTELTVTINPTYAPQSIHDTVCQNTVYNQYGIQQTFTTTGEFDFPLNTLSSKGCDSVVTLYVYVKPVISSSFTAEACDTYTWNDITYNTSNDYTQNFTAANGCDSVVTLHLTIHESNTGDTTATACETFDWYEQTNLTHSGDYTRTFTNAAGCDSVVTLHLTIHPAYNQDITETACESYTWAGETYQISGDYTHTFVSSHNCDSTVTLHLTIYNPAFVELQDQVCANTHYTANGFDTLLTQAGDYTLTKVGETSHGCDSTTVLTLTVNPVFETVLYDTICHNETYTFNGQSYSQTGTYTANLQSALGCDSTVVLHLYVYPQQEGQLTADLCLGESYTENGFDITPTASGSFQITTQDAHGCDSITTLYVTVHQADTTYLEASLCLGGQYTQNGFDFTADSVGVFTDELHLQTVYDCDSTVILTVTVNPTDVVLLYDSVCAGGEYAKYGFDTTFTQSGIHSLTHFNENRFGCDSTTTLTLTVLPVYNNTIQKMICENSSYVFNGETLTEAGVYDATLTTIDGCDSLVTLILTVGSEYRDTIDAHICAGTSYHSNGFDIETPESSLFDSHTLLASNGCDSVVVLHLFVHQPNTAHLYQTLCLGESYRQHGFNVTASEVGTADYTRHTTTPYGCDSTIVLHLTVNPTSNVTLYDNVCANTEYQEHGFDTLFHEAGTYTLTRHDQNTYLCDSTTTLILTVNPTHHTELTETVCDSLVWNNISYYESGEYTQSFSNRFGCDSTVTLFLTVNHSNATEFDTTYCVSFTWNEQTYTESGSYSQTFVNASGCDSTVTMHLTLYPADTIELYDTACLHFSWNDSTYYHSGDYTEIFTNANGCDSVVTLHLTIHTADEVEIFDTACISYTWNESTYTESGEYVQHFTNVNGCDSTVTLHLTVQQALFNSIEKTACDSYTWNDSTYYKSGEYVQQFISANGCDSTVTLTLTLYQAADSVIYEFACGYYVWNDSTYHETGDYTQHFSTVHGCDSTVTLHLTVYPTAHTEFTAAECISYSWNDSTYFESGDHVQYFNTIHGCDSTVTLHLTIYPAQVEEVTKTACDSYVWNDSTYYQTGIYTRHFTTSHDCDSTVVLNLTIHNSYTADTTVNICDVDVPYEWNNEQYWETGDYTMTGTTVSGCDSILTLHLNVHQTYSQDTTVTVCQGALPYYFDADHSFSQSGVHHINLQTASGCDSIWHLHLTVTPNAEHTASQTICDSQLPYTFMGEQFTAAGTYDITESDDNNCLTITHFTLNVNPNYHHFDTVTVCEETLPYIYGTTPLSESGTYDIHFFSTASCDSLVTVLFNVIPTASGVDELFVCASDFPVTYGNETFNTEGVYSVTFHRDGLCDSIVTLTIHQVQEYLMTESDDVCDHALPYLWRGQELTLSGIYYDSLVTSYGCDSIYRLQLTVNETQLMVDNPIVLCQGDSALWQGTYLTETGTYRDTVTSDLTGCRIIHEVTVTVNPTYLFEETVTICSDELPYQWHGMTLNEAGFREDYHQTANLCDSIYRLTLVVNPSYHLTESVEVCDYDLPYLWHGQSLTESGTFTDTLPSVNGCDSTFMLTFTVHPSSYLVTIDTVCNSVLPYSWRSHQITAAGTYFDTVPNTYGCNDIYELQLTVNQSSTITIYDTICQGGQYTAYGFDTLATTTGTLYDQLTLTNASGCDSTVNLILNVLPTYLFETYAETCENVPYAWHDGTFVTEGTYYDSLTTAAGCDSVYVLHLTINPTYEIFVSDSAMNGHEYQYDNFIVTPSDSGTYHYDIQYYTVAGCDSVVRLTLFVAFNDGIDEFEMTPEFSFFPNPTQAALNITGERMRRIQVYDLNGRLVLIADPDTPEQTRINVSGFATGHYVVKVLLDDGNSVTGKIIVDRK